MKLHAAPAGASNNSYLPAFCFSTDVVGDVVYIMGAKVGLRYQVTRVDIDDISTVPAIGILIAKDSATTCIVQIGGLLSDVYTSLTPHKPLFIGLTGRLDETPPDPVAGRRAVQMIAQALSSADVLIHVKSPIIRVAP